MADSYSVNVTGTNLRIRADILLLVAFCGFLFFYGLGAFGLVGADEPRYAQIAREMLDRSDWITPTLDGKPWLEKPPLYYWQAALVYKAARKFSAISSAVSASDGVTDQTARLPAAIDATLMIAAIYLFLRRLRPGTELDGALIAASCAGVIGFARAAATDMPLTATFAMALLSWFGSYESGKRVLLVFFYIFLALGTLAKGPVAPALAVVIVVLFAAIKRDWALVPRSLWLPGIASYLAISLPWYVAVQMRNPEFFRFFILEHNLARFSTSVYHHPQPFWFFLPVFLLATTPWTIWLIAAIVERAGQVWRDRGEAFTSDEDSWPLFLLIWVFVPVLFFSASRSKLPGYILPAVPAAALLVTDYLAARRKNDLRISWPLAVAHGILCGMFVFVAFSAGPMAMNHRVAGGDWIYIASAIAVAFALAIAIVIVTNVGSRLLRSATMIAVVVSVTIVIRFAAPAIDAAQSARSVAELIRGFSREPAPVALYHVSRVTEYGMEFYLNHPVQRYDTGQIPEQPHVLLAAPDTEAEFRSLLGGRKVSYLTRVPAQEVELYWVGKE